MKAKLIRGAGILLVAVIALFGFSFGFSQKSEQTTASAQTTEQVYSLYEEDFNDVSTRVEMVSGHNHSKTSTDGWIYSKKSTNGSAYVENGRMYFSGSAYDVIYRDGGQTWGNYTLEADMCYTSSTGWGGMLFNVQSDKKWQKGGITVNEAASINGYDNNWSNNVAGTNTGFKVSDAINVNEPFRLKIVVENKTAIMYYALYNNGVLGDWKQAVSINNIPANAQTGSIGFLTSNGTNNFVSYWVDNVKCYSSSTISYTENFDSYGDVTFTANGTHAASGYNYLVHKTAGSATITGGQVVFTGGSSHDALLFTASKNWTNYAFEADVTYITNVGWMGIMFRSTDLNNFQKAGITVDDASGNNSAVTNGKYGGSWYMNTAADGYSVAYNQANIKVNVKHRLKIVVEENSSKLYVAYYDADGTLGDWNLAITRENKLHPTQMIGMIGLMSNNKCKMAFDNVVVHRGTDRMTTPTHTYTFVNGTNDCVAGGIKDHYACNGCDKLFIKNGDSYVEVDKKDLEIKAEGHGYNFVEEVPATEEEFGVKEHYECDACGKLFVEENGVKIEVSEEDLKIDKIIPVQKIVIYQENFNDVTTRANFRQGVNYADSSVGGWVYYGKSSNGSAYVENGRMYFSGSAYDVIYRDGGQTWGNYTLEADMCYTSNTGWGGMLFNVQSDKKWQKGGVSISGKASINGYDNNWVNDVSGVNKGFTISDTISLNTPFRLKIVVENKNADLYYALYNNGVLGEWKKAVSISNIPASSQTGSIGFLTSNGTNNFVSYWVDNIECYSTSNVSFSEDFESYGNVSLTANSVNTALGLNYLIPSGKTAGTAEIKDGQLVFTGGNSHDGILFTAGANWTNYEFESDVTYLNGSGWTGLMVRSHSVTNFRKAGVSADNASGANTASINGKNNSMEWYNNVTGTDIVPYDKAVIPLNTKIRLKVVVEENSSKMYIAYYNDGKLGDWEYVMGTEDRFPDGQMSGTVGFMSNSKCQVAFDNVVVRRGTDRMTEIVIPKVADIYEVESGIVNPPIVVQNLTTSLPAIEGERPAVLLVEVDANLNILDNKGTVISAIDQFIDTYRNSLIPAFIIDSQAEATALANKIKEKNLIDCYVVASSQNASLVRSVRLANEVTKQISGALIFDDLNSVSARKEARALVVDNMSYVAISKTLLSEESAHYFNVRQISAWSMVSNKADIYNGIACGYHGMVTTSPALVYDVYESITNVTVSGKPVIIAHRGANNLIAGGPAYPENTIMGYKAAIEKYGADALEVDVRISSDGYLFLLHDPTLDRTTNGSGNAANLTLAQLKALTVDEVAGKETTIPTVEELFELIKGTDVAIYAHINVATDTVIASFNHLIDKYDCRDNVLFFISNDYADDFNSTVSRTVSNAAYSLTNVPVVKSGSLYTSGDVPSMFSGKSDELAGIEAMRGNLNLHNYQPLFYPYFKQGNMWATESFYYQLSARGFVNTHSITDSQGTMDTVGLTGAGAVGYLTDCIHLCDDYHYAIDVKDEIYHVGQFGSFNKTLKLIKGTVNVDCGFITLGGENLIVTDNGYKLSGAGSTTVVFYASRKADGGSVYTVYSKPVTITYTDHEYVLQAEEAKQCTKNGTKEHYTCKGCDKLFVLEGELYVEVTADDLIIPASHELKDVAPKDKTCTEDGYTAHKACTKCDYTEGKVVIPAGHDLKDVEGKDKTCTEDGYTAHKACNKCDYTEGKVVIPAGHEFENNAKEEYIFLKATCKTPAKYFKSCSLCGEKGDETFEYGEPLDHNWGNVVKEENKVSGADCDHKAVYKKSCMDCGEVHDTETFEHGVEAGHNWVSVVDEKYLVSGATCTEQAVYKVSCSRCGKAHEEDTFAYGSTLGHSYKYKGTIAPIWSEKKNGYELWVCENDEEHTQQRNTVYWHTLSARVIVVDGMVNGAESVTVEKGTSVTVIANAIEGKTFKYWTINGEMVSEENEYTFVANDNTKIVAVFEKEPEKKESPSSCGANAMEIFGLVMGLCAVAFIFKKR